MNTIVTQKKTCITVPSRTHTASPNRIDPLISNDISFPWIHPILSIKNSAKTTIDAIPRTIFKIVTYVLENLGPIRCIG